MEKNAPTHVIKAGNIRAAIWANERDDNTIWFNVGISRRYKDGDEWKSTSSFGRDELPVVNKAVDMAYKWILRHEQNRLEEGLGREGDTNRRSRRA